jgi:hypothetical protein
MILEMEGCEIVGMEQRRAKGLEVGVLVLEPMGSCGRAKRIGGVEYEYRPAG